MEKPNLSVVLYDNSTLSFDSQFLMQEARNVSAANLFRVIQN